LSVIAHRKGNPLAVSMYDSCMSLVYVDVQPILQFRSTDVMSQDVEANGNLQSVLHHFFKD